MRQVPLFTQYALLGGGRLAQHLSYYFESLSLPFWAWTDARKLTPDFFSQLSGTSHVMLLVSDSAIDEVAQRIRNHPAWLRMSESERPKLIHASGATSVEGVSAAHPLMTFPAGRLYPKEFYPKIPFTVFQPEPEAILPGLPNPVHQLPVEKQGLYHALCVVYGNLPQLLWAEADAVRSELLRFPREAFRPFLEASLQNFLTAPEAALTGPFIRQDVATIQRHVEVLAATRLSPLYSGFVELFVETKLDTNPEKLP